MKLDFDSIRSAATGAVRVTREEDGIHFFRFTEEQELLYQKRSQSFYRNTFATSGVRLRFRTDSPTLSLDAAAECTGSRKYFSFDLVVNGEFADSVNNFDPLRIPEKYTKIVLPQLPCKKTFSLGDGVKEVCLYLPWSAKVALKDLSLADGASFQPVRPEKKLLCFGDSITQGFDTLHPSKKYASQLAEYLGAEEINKAIGGERFFPALAAAKDDFDPEYISVAYGTNDWNKSERGTFEKNCKAFFENLVRTYPHSEVFVITPIWRKIWEQEKPVGPFRGVDEYIRLVTQNMESVTVIDGFDFVPKEPSFFADGTLHPKDQGFDEYFKSLRSALPR